MNSDQGLYAATDLKRQFSKKLRNLLDIRGMTHGDLAEEVTSRTPSKLSLSTVDNWCSDSNNIFPRADNLFYVCKVLDCDMDYFFDETQASPHKNIETAAEKIGISYDSIMSICNFSEKAKVILEKLARTETLDTFLSDLYEAADESILSNDALEALSDIKVFKKDSKINILEFDSIDKLPRIDYHRYMSSLQYYLDQKGSFITILEAILRAQYKDIVKLVPEYLNCNIYDETVKSSSLYNRFRIRPRPWDYLMDEIDDVRASIPDDPNDSYYYLE